MTTIKEQWQDFEKQVMEDSHDEKIRLTLKRIFYTGVIAMIQFNHESSLMSKEDALQAKLSLIREIKEYIDDDKAQDS